MRPIDEIIERIEEIDADPRMSYPDALVEINAPLAMIQSANKTERHALMWAGGILHCEGCGKYYGCGCIPCDCIQSSDDDAGQSCPHGECGNCAGHNICIEGAGSV